MTILRKRIKLPAFTRSDIWVFLSIIPVMVIICNGILLGADYFRNWKIFLIATAIYFSMMFLVFHICGALAIRFYKIFPEIKDTQKRLLLSITCFMAVTVLSITPLMQIYKAIPLLNFHSPSYTHLGVAGVCILCNIIITITFEGLAAFERWKATLFETEQLKKENLKSQLQSLKNQINPHFLFNSINSLSSLIAEDPGQAEKFLDEMSKVYRYLLRNNEDNLIPLSMELQFIYSYFHLLKTRYGEGIGLSVTVSDASKALFIPPLTLQILLENAVKHNMILKKKPLIIEIMCMDDETLIVKNNLQRKTSMVLSNKVGLENIAAKYMLLNQPEILIVEENNEFVVKVPLIKSIT
jgi:sensor histidine kinase YesM